MDTTITTTSFDVATISAIAGCAISLVTLFVTVISVIYAYRAYRHQKDRSKKDAACELARYYSENIMQRYTFVNFVIIASGIAEKTKELFRYEDINEFTNNELCATIKRQGLDIEEVSPLFEKVDGKTIYKVKVMLAKSVSDRKLLAEEHIWFEEDESAVEGVRVDIQHKDLLERDFYDEAYSLLNDLEWFAMSCRYGLSDEKMLYQSLQTTYLSLVWVMYYFIASRNVRGEDKLYTNVIWLFNEWKKRLLKIKAGVDEMKQKHQDECEQQRTKIEELERIGSSIDAPIYTGTTLR